MEKIFEIYKMSWGMKLSVSSFAEMPDDVMFLLKTIMKHLSAEQESRKPGSIPSAAVSRKR